MADTTADKYQMVDVTALGLSETALEYARVLQQGRPRQEPASWISRACSTASTP